VEPTLLTTTAETLRLMWVRHGDGWAQVLAIAMILALTGRHGLAQAAVVVTVASVVWVAGTKPGARTIRSVAAAGTIIGGAVTTMATNPTFHGLVGFAITLLAAAVSHVAPHPDDATTPDPDATVALDIRGLRRHTGGTWDDPL